MKARSGVARFDPDYVVVPGETLSEVLENQGMSQAELARRTGLSPKHINQIVSGEAPISPETALKFEPVTRMPARFWTQLEAGYRDQVVRTREDELLRADLDWLRGFPLSELIKRDWIEASATGVEQLRQVLSFFGVASRSAWETIWDVPTAYRTSRTFDSDLLALATWLRIGERRAEDMDLRAFNPRGFRAALRDS